MSVQEISRDVPIFVAGHRGLVGSALVRRLAADGCSNILTTSRHEVDLRDASAVDAWFVRNRPQLVFLAAGTVGGILANSTRPAEFLYDNLMIHANVIHASYRFGVERLLYLGSSCIYPRDCPQPMKEEYLLSGALEWTNEPYSIAKISGIKMCQSYRRQYGCDFHSAMPTNLYGTNDNFDLESSHVLPALMRKFHEAKVNRVPSDPIWGTGTPRRELLNVDDLADACVFLMKHYEEDGHINIGTGEDLTIRELAELVREIVYPQAKIEFDTSRPDGTPRKQLDVSRLHAMGWRHQIELRDGVRATYEWFQQNVDITSAAS